MALEVRLAGVTYIGKGPFQLRRQAGAVSQTTVQVRLDAQSVPTTLMSAQVLIDGTAVFLGLVNTVTHPERRTGAEPKIYTLSLVSIETVLTFRIANKVYENKTYTEIITDLVSTYLTEEGISLGGVSTFSGTVARYDASYKKLSDVFADIADAVGQSSFWITPAKAFYFRKQAEFPAATVPTKVRFQLTEANSGIRTVQHVRGASASIVGQAQNTSLKSALAAANGLSGKVEAVENDKAITTGANAGTRAAELLTQYADREQTLDATCFDLTAGELFRSWPVNRSDVGIVGTYVVVEQVLTYREGVATRVGLKLKNKSFFARSGYDVRSVAVQAQEALQVLSEVAADNKFTPVEKINARTDWSIIVAEKDGLVATATTYGLATEKTAYLAAFQALADYLNGGAAWSTGLPLWLTQIYYTTDIDATTFDGKWAGYYSARTALVQAAGNLNPTSIDASAITRKADGSYFPSTVKVESKKVGAPYPVRFRAYANEESVPFYESTADESSVVLPVDGPALVRDWDFRFGGAGWNLGAGASVVSMTGHDGTTRNTLRQDNLGGEDAAWGPLVPAVAGASFRVSIMHRAQSADGSFHAFYIRFLNAGGSEISTLNPGRTASDTGWHLDTQDIVTPSGTNAVQIVPNTNGAGAGLWYTGYVRLDRLVSGKPVGTTSIRVKTYAPGGFTTLLDDDLVPVASEIDVAGLVPVYTPRYLGRALDSYPTPNVPGDVCTRYSLTNDSAHRGVFKWDGTAWNRTNARADVMQAGTDIGFLVAYRDTSGAAIYGTAGDYVSDSAISVDFGFFQAVFAGFVEAQAIKVRNSLRGGNRYDENGNTVDPTASGFFLGATGSCKVAGLTFEGAQGGGVQWSGGFQVGAGLTIAGAGFPALCGLNGSDVAFVDATNKQLQLYRWSGIAWTMVGTGLTITGAGSPALCALNGTDVAYIDLLNRQLRVYRWSGSAWSLVGSGLSISGIGVPKICSLNATDVAFMDTNNLQLRVYRWSGSAWSQVGSSLTIAGAGVPSLCALNGADVAYIDSTIEELRVYHWSGTAWSQVGSGLSIPGIAYSALCSLNGTDVTFIDSTFDQLQVYRWAGSGWSIVGSAGSPLIGGGIPALCALNGADVAFVDSANKQLRVYHYNFALSKPWRYPYEG